MKSMTKNQAMSLISALLLMIAYCLTNNTIGYFIAPVTEGFGISRAAFNFYFTIMSVVSLVTAPVYGQLLGRFSSRKIILTGAVFGGLCFVLLSLSSHIFQFYAIAAMLGLFQYGTTSMVCVVMINRAFSEGSSGTAMGIASSGTGLGGAAISLFIPGFLVSYGWQNGYRIEGVLWFIIMLVAAFLAGFGSNEPAQNKSIQQADDGAASPDDKSGRTLSEALRTPVLYIFIGAIMIITIMMIFIQHLPAFIVELGLTETESGRIMSLISICLLVGHIVIGWISDRFSANAAIMTGLLTFLAGMLMMSFASGMAVLIAAGGGITAFGMSMTTVLFPIYTRKMYGIRYYSQIWGFVSSFFVLGTSIGSPVWGFIYDRMGSYISAVRIAPFLALGAGIVMIILAKKQEQEP